MRNAGAPFSWIQHVEDHLSQGKRLVELQTWWDTIPVSPDEMASWIRRPSQDTDGYTRNVLYRNKWMEVVLICWTLPNQSKIHGHPEHGCLYRILYGQLQEQIFSKDKEETYLCSPSSGTRYIDDTIGYHQVRALTHDMTLSLHIYSPPLEELSSRHG